MQVSYEEAFREGRVSKRRVIAIGNKDILHVYIVKQTYHPGIPDDLNNVLFGHIYTRDEFEQAKNDMNIGTMDGGCVNWDNNHWKEGKMEPIESLLEKPTMTKYIDSDEHCASMEHMNKVLP